MEIFLNLAWASIAALLVCLWLRFADRDGMERRRQLIAIGVLIAILLPVISVSDDLLAMQRATETDTCQRRDQYFASNAHTLLPFVAVLSPAVFDGLPFGFIRYVAPGALPTTSLSRPECTALQNRPPPAA